MSHYSPSHTLTTRTANVPAKAAVPEISIMTTSASTTSTSHKSNQQHPQETEGARRRLRTYPSPPTTYPPSLSSRSPSPTPSDSTVDAMLGRDNPRARHNEDINDLEEKGLLERVANGPDAHQVAMFEKAQEEVYEPGLKSKRDQQAFALLVVLYLLQGIPLGLTFGTLPFLLKPRLSYSALAAFALSTWPYSLKLFWSPVVDAWFVPKWGRRKSWVVPVQAIVGVGLWIIGHRVEGWLQAVSS